MQSAVGGMVLSVVGMLLAAMGYLPPVAGAVIQEVIDILAVVNALAWRSRQKRCWIIRPCLRATANHVRYPKETKLVWTTRS